MPHANELRDRLARLVDELGPLASACVVASSNAVAEPALKLVASDQRWRFADLRNLDGTQARVALSALLDAQVVVLALAANNLRLASAALISAAVDGSEQVDLGDLIAKPRAPGQSLFLLVQDCPAFAEAPRELQRVSYWDWITPPPG